MVTATTNNTQANVAAEVSDDEETLVAINTKNYQSENPFIEDNNNY
jgi:hypothetical protein